MSGVVPIFACGQPRDGDDDQLCGEDEKEDGWPRNSGIPSSLGFVVLKSESWSAMQKKARTLFTSKPSVIVTEGHSSSPHLLSLE